MKGKRMDGGEGGIEEKEEEEHGYLERLVDAARSAVRSGHYEFGFTIHHRIISMRDAILSCKRSGKNAIIAEVKFASPSMGRIRDYTSPQTLARDMVDAGAMALSVLTQPNYFNGSIEYLMNVRVAVDVPLLMKDIIVSREQVDAAYRAGADCILLISSIYTEGLADDTLERMIDRAHAYGLEVILEVHDEDEFDQALKSTADIIGINNRDLKSMNVDVSNTARILAKHDNNNKATTNKPIISESGISSVEHIRYLKQYKVDAFLIGTSIMASDNIKNKVRELVMA
ncbi:MULTISPECIES: indole-3-glycerol-phosphate synthase [Candidatus Nitrosocaldus]|jgi:indole-3-glycerol phosphate synthase|nr:MULTISPECIES: indole-3-glycerol-phosphate synthase [Candidatus Nitrosocaldus]